MKLIVDEFTGRQMPGARGTMVCTRPWKATEGVKIERENQTLATITFQNYFRMYKKLSTGMTGTPKRKRRTFGQLYNWTSPSFRQTPPCSIEYPDFVTPRKRKVEADSNGINCQKKFARQRHPPISQKRGQTVLVGTISIEKSRGYSGMEEADIRTQEY